MKKKIKIEYNPPVCKQAGVYREAKPISLDYYLTIFDIS